MPQSLYVQTGDSIDYIPAADVPAGSVIELNERIGIAKLDIPAGTVGALCVRGVFDIPKATGAGTAIPLWARLYWDPVGQVATLAVTHLYLGTAILAAGDNDARVRVRINDGLPAAFVPFQPIFAPVDSGTVIAVGDLLYLDTDDAKPAADHPDQGTEAANQEAFHDKFLGRALQPSQDGETDDILVAATGLFEYAAPSATYELGDFLGVDENFGGTALENQQVAKVATANLAVGRCARREGVVTSKVLVWLQSTVFLGGPQDFI